MASPISGAAATNATVIEFLSLTSLEAQFAYAANLLLAAQTTYNTANPGTTIVRASIGESVSDVQILLGLQLSDTAASQTLVAGTIASEFPATKLTDGAATGNVATLLALPTLEAQIMSLATNLQNQEMTYNAANPTAPVNRVSITPDYNTKNAGVVATLPLSSLITTRPVVAYLP